MNIAKNKLKLLFLLAVAMLCMALLTACEGDSSSGVSEIFVQKDNMPRQTYVLGQELNLNDGILTAVIDGKPGLIPMNNSDVQVSGYDKNKLGRQTVTITYKGKTTTIDITVVQRVVAEGFKTDYFVNDPFDNKVGKIRITKNDGTVIAVNMNSTEVMLKHFDSSKSGETTVTLIYTGEEIYECEFKVNIHDVAKITLTTPKKTKYVSHETELELNGGYLTVEAANVPGLSQFVYLTADMVTGYDPSVVTYENRDQVVTQTLTVTYSGLTANFDVQIAYSDVHLVQYMATQLSHLDWTAEELPTLLETEEDNAIAGIEAYLRLSPAAKEQITEEQRNAVLFPAVLALRMRYENELQSYADAFVIADGYLKIVGKTRAAIASASERLQDPEELLNVYADIQLQIGEELGETPFRDGVIGQMMMAHSQNTVDKLVDIFDVLLDVHDALANVPTDWTVEGLQEYEVSISNAVSKIMFSEYRGMDHAYLHHIISSWREKNDMAQIIYSYYYFVKERGKEEIKAKLWQNTPMPGELNNWYTNFMYAYNQEQFLIENADTNAFLYDTAGFMYYYFKAETSAEKIRQSDDELVKGIYELLEGDALMDRNLKNGSLGYLYHMGAGLDSPAVQDAWNKYVVLVDIYLNDPTATYSKYEKEFQACFDMLVDMEAMELHMFLSSVNFLYEASRGGIRVLDCTTRNYSTLTGLLYNYYATVLPKDMMSVYCNILLALENYSLRNMQESALGDFKALVVKIKTAYEGMSEEDRAIFDTYLGKAYSKCLSIYSRVKSNKSVDLGDTEAKLEELLALLRRSDLVIAHITADTTPEEKSRILPVYFAIVERIDRVYQELLDSGADVRMELQTRTYNVEGYEITLDYYHIIVKRLFVQFMTSTVIQTDDGGKYPLWSMYHDADVRPLLAEMAGLLYASYSKQVYTGDDVYAMMAAFRALTPEEKKIFFIMGVNQSYYAGLETYFGSRVTSGIDLIRALIYAEINYSVHTYTNTDESLAAFTSKVEEMIALYEALENKKAFDDCLGELYNHYLNKYKELKAKS